MPTLKETEASLSYVQWFFYLVSSSISVSIFPITWLSTFWTDLVYLAIAKGCDEKMMKMIVATKYKWLRIYLRVQQLPKQQT